MYIHTPFGRRPAAAPPYERWEVLLGRLFYYNVKRNNLE